MTDLRTEPVKSQGAMSYPEVLAEMRSLLPIFRARVPETTKLRRLPEATCEDIRKSGLARIWNVPLRLVLLKYRLPQQHRPLNGKSRFVLAWRPRRASATGWRRVEPQSSSRPPPRSCRCADLPTNLPARAAR